MDKYQSNSRAAMKQLKNTFKATQSIAKAYLLLFSNIVTLSKKKNFKKVSITLNFTLACSDFFWNFKTFFLKGHYY
jgi:hypothetical protein